MPEIIHTPAEIGEPAAKAVSRPRIPAWLSTLVRIVITLGLLGVVLRGVNLPAFLEVLERVDWRWWLAGMGLGIGAQVIAGIRWASLARPVGFSFSVATFVWRFFEGMFFSLCLPSSIGGDVVKAYRLADSGPRRILAGCTVLADRMTGLAALGVLAGAAVIAAKWSLGPWTTLGTGAALLLATLAVFRIGVGSIDRLLAAIPAPHPAREFIAQLLPYQARPNLMTHALVWSLLIQISNAVSVSMIARGLGVTLPLSVWCVVVPMVMLAMVVPISINGVGVREGGMAMLLAPHAVASEQAVAIALLWFLAGIVSGLIGGLLFLLDSRPTQADVGGR
jgi:uncharacterized membrane protein YbhN (UPF0104 family)